MKQQLSIYFIVFMIGLGVGYAFTPEYAQMKGDQTESMSELGEADRFLDLRYVNNMIAHHLSAIDMAKQALVHSKRPEILDLTQVIITTDERGIQQLYEYKRIWYGDTKEVKTYEKKQLGTADELFDLRFINAMITHHQMAIESAHEVSQKSTRNEILTLADEVDTNLSAGVKQLTEWRKQWYEN